MVLICISLIINDAEPFFMYLLAICVFSLETVFTLNSPQVICLSVLAISCQDLTGKRGLFKLQQWVMGMDKHIHDEIQNK